MTHRSRVKQSTTLAERLEHLGRQRDRLTVAHQKALEKIQAKWSKFK